MMISGQKKRDTGGIVELLYPDNVGSVFSGSIPANVDRYPEEEQLTKRMAEQRLREFQHGRNCARLALSMLGQPPGPIGRGQHRERYGRPALSAAFRTRATTLRLPWLQATFIPG